MLLVPCPHCGPRNASEFRYVGEPSIRPDPGSATTAEWRSYLYDRSNPVGWQRESWYHRAGCRKFFSVERHTLTNEVRRQADAEADAAGPVAGGTVAEQGSAVDATAVDSPQGAP